MEIKPIRTKADYRAALKEIETLMDAEAGTPEGERLDVLATLVEAYERKHFPMDLPDPVEAIKFRMEQSGLGPKDFGSRTSPARSCARPRTAATRRRFSIGAPPAAPKWIW